MSSTFTDHFTAVTSHYARFRPTYPAALFAWLATIAPDRELAWDCAAGNGQATLDLAQYFTRVIATDASRAQIEAAPPCPNVEYRVAPAEASGLSTATISMITVAQALHWFDQDRFHAEVRRVLKPEGVLAAWTYGPLTVDETSVTVCAPSAWKRWLLIGHPNASMSKAATEPCRSRCMRFRHRNSISPWTGA